MVILIHTSRDKTLFPLRRSVLFILRVFVSTVLLLFLCNVTRLALQLQRDASSTPSIDLLSISHDAVDAPEIYAGMYSAQHRQTLVSRDSPSRSISSVQCPRLIRSFADLKACYPERVADWIQRSGCQSISTWRDVQKCINGRYRFKKDEHLNGATVASDRRTKIRTVHILGERNSGTKFLQRSIQQCFPRPALASKQTSSAHQNTNNSANNIHIKAHRDWIRAKHFFQPLETIMATDDDGRFDHSLIIVVVRDPLDWLASMREKPYHSPNHARIFHDGIQSDETKSGNHTSTTATPLTYHPKPFLTPLAWLDFLSKSWSMPRSTSDIARIHRGRAAIEETTAGTVCNYDFPFWQVSPCDFELDEYSSHSLSQTDATTTATTNGTLYIPPSMMRGYMPLYELQRTHPTSNKSDNNNNNNNVHDSSSLLGTPFDNILELRAEKMIHFLLELPILIRVGGYLVVRYEDLLSHGTGFVMEQIARIVLDSSNDLEKMEDAKQEKAPPGAPTEEHRWNHEGIQVQLPEGCKPAVAQPERLGRHRRRAQIPPLVRQHIRANLDASVENLAGYGSEDDVLRTTAYHAASG